MQGQQWGNQFCSSSSQCKACEHLLIIQVGASHTLPHEPPGQLYVTSVFSRVCITSDQQGKNKCPNGSSTALGKMWHLKETAFVPLSKQNDMLEDRLVRIHMWATIFQEVRGRMMPLQDDWRLLVSPSARELKGVSRWEINNLSNQSLPPPPPATK